MLQQTAAIAPETSPESNDLGHRLRRDFPLLVEHDVVYLDSAASAQKPAVVLDALAGFYRHSYANIHRGVYELSVEATEKYERSRQKVAAFINARSAEEIVFTRGATESINLVAYSWARTFLSRGDEILISLLEHHSNFVPWQIAAEQIGAKLQFIGLLPDGTLDLDDFSRKLTSKTKLVSITQLANGLGVAPPVHDVVRLAHAAGARVLVDGAQSAAHEPVDVQALGADFFVFSGHKVYGPTGIGALYAPRELLEQMPPFLSGGDMIRSVSVRGTEYNDVPFKFEAGTPNIAGTIGLGAAVDYVSAIGMAQIAAHEARLVTALEERLAQMPRVRMLGPQRGHKGLICFVFEGVHPHDLAQFLSDKCRVAVRAGHHCAQPLLELLCVPASTRASFGLYNTHEDVNALCEGLEQAGRFFR